MCLLVILDLDYTLSVLSWNFLWTTQFTTVELGYACRTSYRSALHESHNRELWVIENVVNKICVSLSLGKHVYWNCCECSSQNYVQICPETCPKLIPENWFSFAWMMEWYIIYFSSFDYFISNSGNMASGFWMTINIDLPRMWKTASCPNLREYPDFSWKDWVKSRKISVRIGGAPVGVTGTSRMRAGRINTWTTLLDWSVT